MSDSKPPTPPVPPKPPIAVVPPVKLVPPPPPVKVFDLRLPQNASLREAVGIRLEDMSDTITQAAGGTPPGWLEEVLKQFGPLIAMLIAQAFTKKPKPEPVAPTAHQDFPPPKPVVVVPPPVPPGVVHILGGHAKITGATKGGPLGPRLSKAVVDGLLAGQKFGDEILDLRLELDNTPTDGAKDFGADDPRWLGQPSAPHPNEGPIQPFRLKFTYEGDGSADLAHEYANFGCTPRIRVKVPAGGGGALTNIFFEGPDYQDGSVPVRIEVTEGPIYVGKGV